MEVGRGKGLEVRREGIGGRKREKIGGRKREGIGGKKREGRRKGGNIA